MSSKFAYKNIRDQQFILKEWLPSEQIFGYQKYSANFSKDDIEPILMQVLKMSKEIVEPANEDAEANSVRFENGKVIAPPLTGPLFKQMQEEGWGTTNVDDAADAINMPMILWEMCLEMFGAAYPSLMTYLAITTHVAEVIVHYADKDLKALFFPKMMDGTWNGTMGLTEPAAGSDVGDATTKAFPTEDPRIFKIKGQKIFITGVDNGFSENSVNLFLARVEGARPGVAGLSLFLIPRYWVNFDGSVEKEINDIWVTGIEEKMGMHGSATCAVSVGDDNNCRGWLLGINPMQNEGRGNGMALMFKIMNNARVGTGVTAVSLLANAYYNAREYSKERIQGRPLSDPKGGRVAIINHEDIKRILLSCKAHLEAMRAMLYKTYFNIGIRDNDPDPEKRKKASDFVEVATPLCKAYTTEEVWKLVGDCIQAHGGYGYCEDYPVAQIARDCKILSIWEGTTYIQSVDLVGRKWTMNNGSTFGAFIGEIRDFYSNNQNREGFKKEFENLGKALQAYETMQKAMFGYIKKQQSTMMPMYATRILTATSQLWAGSLILEQALIADKKAKELGADHYDSAFYTGKISAARYYLRNVVPNVWSLAEIVEDGDTSVLEVSLDSFEY